MHIHTVTFEAESPEALAYFYGHVLGMPVCWKDQLLLVECGATLLYFKQATVGEAPFYHFAINIPSNAIQQAVAWLEGKATPIFIKDYNSIIADFVNWDAASVYFYDPAGNIVELIARKGIQIEMHEPFSSKQFLHVSEVGLVVPQAFLEAQTSMWLNDYGLHYFSRQKPFPSFKAIGDDHGLFIIVAEGRPWYPTQKASNLSPLQVDFSVDGKPYKLIHNHKNDSK